MSFRHLKLNRIVHALVVGKLQYPVLFAVRQRLGILGIRRRNDRIFVNRIFADLFALNHLAVDKKAPAFHLYRIPRQPYNPLDKIGLVVAGIFEYHHIAAFRQIFPHPSLKRGAAERKRMARIAVSIFGNKQKIADFQRRIH